MATNTAGDQGRQAPWQMTHYLRKAITFADAGTTVSIGTLPPGAVVISAGVVVTTAFNSGVSNLLDIGNEDDTDDYATSLALGTVCRVLADELATTSNNLYNATAKVQKCVVTSSASSAGAAIVYIEYLCNNDG